VIGGNHATNGASWLPPLNSEIDAWNIPGFDGSVMRSYLIKAENASALHFPNRGTSGPVNINFGTFTPTEQNLFKQAAIAAGYPAGTDYNQPAINPGVYLSQYTTLHGIRQSSSIA
jgi:hypothetical protein